MSEAQANSKSRLNAAVAARVAANHEQPRWVLCLGLALVLHASTALVRCEKAERDPPLALSRAASFSLELDPAPAGAGPPGGGSFEPEPAREVARPAPVQRVRARTSAVDVVGHEPAATGSDEREPALDVSELLAAAQLDDEGVPRPTPARRSLLRAPEPQAAAASIADSQAQSPGAALGTGPGVHGGPGGFGAGSGGKLAGRSPFGGPSGAFKATVCFLETEIASLAEIEHCPPKFTFYTDVLNVPPRSFTEGFPGISDRHEWFAIRYSGSFTVRDAETFTFRLLSDDGSWLDIDGYRVIDNDHRHPPRSVEGTVTLHAGKHEFSVFYYQGHPSMLALQLFVRAYNGPERLFGPVI